MHTNGTVLQSVTPSSAHGTDDREAHPKHWVAALVQIRSEKAVGKRLTDLQIENYVPTQWELHQWSDRKKKVERVIIPMIVFIHADKDTIKKLILHSFIHKFISYPPRCATGTVEIYASTVRIARRDERTCFQDRRPCTHCPWPVKGSARRALSS